MNSMDCLADNLLCRKNYFSGDDVGLAISSFAVRAGETAL